MAKPSAKARKGKQGNEPAAPGKVDAKEARRRVARRKRSLEELRGETAPCPTCLQPTTVRFATPPSLEPDAIGRSPRLEKRRRAELIEERAMPIYAGKSPLLIETQRLLRQKMQEDGVTHNTIATIAHMDESTVADCMKCEGNCSAETLFRVALALGLNLDEVIAQARRQISGRTGGQG